MKNILIIRKIVISVITSIILIWAFFQNNFFGKMFISPFIICSLTIFGENLFLLLNKEKISNMFKIIFKISFFGYVFAFLAYACYYAIINKTYGLLIIVAIFVYFSVYFLKRS